MKRLVLVALLLWSASVQASFYGHFNGYTTLSRSGSTVLTATDVQFVLDNYPCLSGCSYRMQGNHQLRESSGGGIVLQKQWGVVSPLHYRANFSANGAPGFCYFAQNNGAAYLTSSDQSPFITPNTPLSLGSDGPWLSATACIPLLPPKPECPGDPSCPPTGNTCLPEDTTCQLSPIVINLGNGKYDLAGDDDPVRFDLDADGSLDRITWTARANRDMAFLALDRNQNGRIDDGAELFGDHTPVPSPGIAANGFDALAALDANGDGLVDARDPSWPRLLLWVDANHDGTSAPPELTPLSSTNITSLEVRYRHTDRTDDDGNVFRYAAKLHRRGAGDRTYYDVYFHRVE
ncbi:MAG TPA: hypothetical protein VGR02_11220 [Thermoanaerobaculia bacterium]|jgi:hypothetical protein|nr:hypothetical protein [Thermoanaerobaculia bacterium]